MRPLRRPPLCSTGQGLGLRTLPGGAGGIVIILGSRIARLQHMPSIEPLLREQRLAMLSFLQGCTVPIVAEKGDVANVVGTGTLFDFGDGLCLVTAAHVLQGHDYGRKDLAVPDLPTGPSMHTLGSFNLLQERDWDIAILQITSPETVDRLRAGWTVLSGGNIQWTGGNGTYALAGCPRESVVLGASALQAEWIAMFVGSYEEEVENGRGEFDVITTYPRYVYRQNGLQQDAPDTVHGLSGTSVWQPSGKIDTGAMWTPEAAMRVTGIQLSSVGGKYIRARSWAIASEMLYRRGQ